MRRSEKNRAPPQPTDPGDSGGANASRRMEGSRPARHVRAALRLLPLAVITAFTVARVPKLWLMLWLAERPRAWDGTGHYGLAQVYDQSIFPDTFGWTHAYFGGMPFPNFYPPLFYWLTALLHHTGLVTFPTAFKLVLAISVLLIPTALWTLGRAAFGGDRAAALAATFAVLPLLLDYRFFNPVGINNASTFLIGLYTQPLGFVLLAAWFASYLGAHRSRWRFALACLLLALTILANFFNAITAALFVIATVASDLLKLTRSEKTPGRSEVRAALAAHVVCPLVGLGLSLFWLVPMVSQYSYFVTRPHTSSLAQLIPPIMLAWYAVSAIGIVCWLRRPTDGMLPYLLACGALAVMILFATSIAPIWFPLQSVRFLSTLNFLLAVPVGWALLASFESLTGWLNRVGGRGDTGTSRGRASRETVPFFRDAVRSAAAVALLISAFVIIRPPSYTLSFLPIEGRARIDEVLAFGRGHPDGRYLVEVAHFDYGAAALDGRAINSYLGAQGNETLSVVFREASPHALFFNPLVTAFSAFPDNFGVSSVLADDLDFIEQPLAQHLERARLIGVKYLVIVSPEIKNRLARELEVGARHELGPWSIFELRGEPPPRVRALHYRPALVVSPFSVKQRRRNEFGFTRLAEEQFADGWFDVLLALSPETKVDQLRELEQFGALVLDTYECTDENRAFERLRDFSQQRALILLSNDSPLFRRIRSRLSEFPRATIVERVNDEPGEWLRFDVPTYRYGESSVRKAWGEIRRALDREKIAIDFIAPALSGTINRDVVQLTPVTHAGEKVPTLVGVTYHPNWQRVDGQAVYAATPFFMLTFVQQQTQIRYQRQWPEWLAVGVSAGTIILVSSLLAWRRRRSQTDDR